MSEFLQRRQSQVRNRRPIAENVSPRVVPAPSDVVPPTATQETTAADIANRLDTIGTQAVQVAAMDKTRRGIRFRNAGDTTLYLGGHGVTTDTAVIKLLPGDLWEETLAAAAARYAISSAPGGILTSEEVR